MLATLVPASFTSFDVHSPLAIAHQETAPVVATPRPTPITHFTRRYLAAHARWSRMSGQLDEIEAGERPCRAGRRLRLSHAVDRAFDLRCELERTIIAMLPHWATTKAKEGEERAIVADGFRFSLIGNLAPDDTAILDFHADPVLA